MGCGCGSKRAATRVARRGSVDGWSVIYPHGAVRPFGSEDDARAFISGRSNPAAYMLVDPSGSPVAM